MITFDLLLIYFGVVVLVLLFLYGTKNYIISLVFGYISFCAFYFAFAITNFQWDVSFILKELKETGIIYIISYVIGIIIYKLLPARQSAGVA